MTVRTTRRDVAFRFPFRLPGIDGEQPAGTYAVETDEELLEHLSFPAWHRVSTSIVIPLGTGSYQMYRIDPADLEAAEARDANASAAPRPSDP